MGQASSQAAKQPSSQAANWIKRNLRKAQISFNPVGCLAAWLLGCSPGPLTVQNFHIYYIMVIIIVILILVLILLACLDKKNQIEKYEPTPDDLYEHLFYVTKLLETHKIKHWIMYGTLLGAIRNNDIISYDYDFDLGAYVSDFYKIMKLNEIIKKDNYKFDYYKIEYQHVNKKKIKIAWKLSIKILYKNIEMGDIYLYEDCSDGFMRRYDKKQKLYFWPRGTFPSWYINKLNKCNIRNKYFNCPRNAHKLLEYWYGPTWNKPIKAMAQGGNYINDDYDYYGGYTKNNLKFVNFQEIKPKMEEIKYVFPIEQKKWIDENEN